MKHTLWKNKDGAKGFIFGSKDFHKKDKLLILVHGSGVVRAGQWARRLVMILKTGMARIVAFVFTVGRHMIISLYSHHDLHMFQINYQWLFGPWNPDSLHQESNNGQYIHIILYKYQYVFSLSLFSSLEIFCYYNKFKMQACSIYLE